MTISEKKEAVRQAIINSNKSKFSGKEMVCKECKREVITSDSIIIRQKPIQLADVLVATKTQIIRLQPLGGNEVSFEILEESNVFTHEQSWKSSGIKWDLSQDFDHQSEAFYLFVWELLCE